MSAEKVASELTVAILPLGSISSIQIEFTAVVLAEEFGVKTIVLPAIKLPTQYFNAERGQYQGRRVLELLFHHLPTDAQRIVGVIAGKLEYDDGEPCLGCSYPHYRVAVYSALPLSEWERLPDNERAKQYEISYIVATHEFGHTFGLPHCEQLDCLMYEAAFIPEMCAACRRWADRELKVKPGSAEERFSLAESLLSYNCFTQAIAVYREAIIRAPHEPLYHSGLAKALFEVGSGSMALQELKLAAELANDNPDLYYSFGIALLNNKSKSEEYFAKAIAVAKDPKFTHRLVGQAYREILHDVELASRHYLEYLRLGGDDPDVVDWLISRSKLDKP